MCYGSAPDQPGPFIVHPCTFVIDMLIYQEQGLNFTAYYQRLEERRHGLDKFARYANEIMTNENMAKEEIACTYMTRKRLRNV
jgi:hypothetical protein